MRHRTLYGFLVVLIVVTGLIFARQLRRAKNIVIKPESEPLIALSPSPILPDPNERILGNPGAPLTITEFIDFNCRKCLETHRELAAFVRIHPQGVRLIFKDAPRPSLLFKSSELAHYGGWCAAKQKQFWQYVDLMTTEPGLAKDANMPKVAERLRFNVDTWHECLNQNETHQQVYSETQLFKQLGLREVPALFVNNKKINLSDDIDLQELLASFLDI